MQGLDPLLDLLPQLDSELRSKKAELLWESLIELEGRRGSSVFFGEYKWRRYKSYCAPFPAVFVQKLNETKWVPGAGELQCPATVLFDDVGWERKPSLQSQIPFMRPPREEELAREVGIEPKKFNFIINFLKERNPTIEELQTWTREKDATLSESSAGTPDSTPAPSAASGTRRGGAGRSHGGGHPATEAFPEDMVPELEPPTSHHTPVEEDEPEEPFARLFFDAQTIAPSAAQENAVLFPSGGPKTEESVRKHTKKSSLLGRSEARVPKIVTTSELGPEGKALADEFRDMVHGDYGKRCQICGRSFTSAGGVSQVFVVHVVSPRADHRTNHFGDLLGLCGWHYALVCYGEWALLDPETKQPFADWERMKEVLLNASEVDDVDNRYRSVPIRFGNVFQDWKPDPKPKDEEMRFSKPHWTYLCELLKT